MKIVVIGDIHGRDCWKQIIENEKDFDKVIFLGDYVSTHEKNITQQMQIDNWLEILQFKQENPGQVILLRGNHDLQHLSYYWAECSGLFPKVQEYMTQHRGDFLENTQWIYVYKDIIFSHAGVSTVWMENQKFLTLEDINKAGPNESFGFLPNNWHDYYGDSITQSCTWIRPTSLLMCLPDNYRQMVGHTPTQDGKVISLKDKVWLCDALPTGYAVVKDNEIITKLL